MAKKTQNALFGLSEQHLARVDGQPGLIHRDVVAPFLRLCETAAAAGYNLAIASGFRSFERQRTIWNAKASGQRPVLSSSGEPLDIKQLSPKERVLAILRWSALPGASRHHWGTDMDIWDPSAVSADYSLQLVPQECEGGGPFAPLHQWLDQQIAAGQTAFYRPYNRDCGGVAPERWHLSYRPVAEQFEAQLSEATLAEQLSSADLMLKEVVLDNLEEIFERFIRVD